MKLVDELNALKQNKKDELYNEIKEQAIEATKKGKTTIFVGRHIDDYTFTKLEENGLKVEFKEYQENYGTDYITEISW